MYAWLLSIQFFVSLVCLSIIDTAYLFQSCTVLLSQLVFTMLCSNNFLNEMTMCSLEKGHLSISIIIISTTMFWVCVDIVVNTGRKFTVYCCNKQ